MRSLSTVDINNDGEISAAEFLSYVQGQSKVNQLWLNRTMVQQPCVIYNAAVHYNHTYAHGGLATRLRREANNTLTAANWEKYQAVWQDIVYLSDKTDSGVCRGSFPT